MDKSTYVERGKLSPQLTFIRHSVLPYPNDFPSCLAKGAVYETIALHVAVKLCDPKIAIRGRNCPVHGTPMPKASIHEYGDLSFPKYKIRCSEHS